MTLEPSMICILVSENGRRNSLLYLRVTTVSRLLRLVEQGGRDGTLDAYRNFKNLRRIETATTIRLVRATLANRERFLLFSATTYSTSELLGEAWGEPWGYS